mmetsp:Transcript_36260/g.91287  ORF Transcript_36260/g.91287 Transcript_36260/m.91287 type:complete len:637 (-) Transcript_36260:178-2088(-)|eukprot:CAMPEP_0115668406 /NCGR_PEP_ID=MMETSP0272-20121206/50451_1 /TAXON_ID=71861 /ORGANISM="Scrippsiella trochoidea, Strain CCMP3099" /LENGTH=636 /DNA_ID=CAMNT_0003107007 /DNA_START=52 /DNA_END=1962 /DNA_ORIENTATION=+
MAPAGVEGSGSSKEDPAALQEFIDGVNVGYDKVHRDFEDQFWGTKMALKGDCFSVEKLGETKGKMEAFLADPVRLQETRRWLKSGIASEEQTRVLKIFERTFGCYIMESSEAKDLREKSTKLEGEIASARGKMRLGAELPGEGFKELSSVQLRNRMLTSVEEPVRKACFEGLASIGPFVCEQGFPELVKQRNNMARKLGYVDFYDYKVTQSEGFSKARLFEILDTLETGTRGLLEEARKRLVEEKGEAALQPWNKDHMMAGSVTKKLDPFFPFEKAVESWARSYAALRIGYKGATMTLDLLDRKGKYSNGFCHWPQPAWVRPDGSWQPSATNFTSLADPQAVGSGLTALKTLMHEAGHAAHFANVTQPSPLFSQERAPTSVAYAENQSMFLDSLVKDAAWRGRYARDRKGQVVPWELLEEDLVSRKPYEVFHLRALLAVPYFEKALYELPDDEVSATRIQELAREVEGRIQGGPAARPLLAVPHILADESSCYYHGYVLAQMAVYQTREHFLAKHGRIVDNPAVGPSLTENYWRPGNSRMFLDLVEGLTGKPLTGDAWVRELEEPLKKALKREREEYEEAVKAGPAVTGDLDLAMHMRIVDGDEVITDSRQEGSFLAAAQKFERYVRRRTGETAAL